LVKIKRESMRTVQYAPGRSVADRVEYALISLLLNRVLRTSRMVVFVVVFDPALGMRAAAWVGAGESGEVWELPLSELIH